MAVNPENYYTGDGSTTSYSFTFQYIDEDDIKVSLDGVVTNAYTLANATTILLNTAPANGVEVRIYRETNVDDLKSTFFAGSAIRAQDLNENFLQNNYAVQEIKAYSWDNETQTIHSDEPWVSSDSQIATTAAMDQRFQDEATETIESTEVWVSDDDHIATTAAIDARFQDELSETIRSDEVWVADDDHIATTQAIEDRIDEVITNDIDTDGTGITITDNGDGTITLGIGANSVDLDRIKDEDILTSLETWVNSNTKIPTTYAVDERAVDLLESYNDVGITTDGTGITLNKGALSVELGLGANSIDLDRIKDSDIITYAEQNAGSPAPADTNIFTASAAARRFDTLVQVSTPTGSDWEVGKTWLQNDVDKTLSIWNGLSWEGVSSGGTFINQAKVVYVDATNGNNLNDGHRISRPKQTIKAAIEQINAEIDIEISNGGSGYVEDVYTSVPLTGGTSTGLTADITVNASGVVSAVTINNTATLENYLIGDVLSASNSNLGGTGSGLQITVTGDGDGQVVIVSPGVYQEVAPIQIKRRNVSIIGQALRSCLVHPTAATETNNLFELNSGSYLAHLTFTGVKAGSGTGNALDATLPVNQGWNAAFYDNAYITKSPYIQNCTNFSDSEIDNSNLNAHNPGGGQAGDLDSAPTGGGLLVNGATPHDDSPLRSMVCDSYTHVALNGPGILVTNNGYAQCTSSYAFFNKYHIKCLNGGQANLAASTTDFGASALVADGKSTTAIFTADLSTNANDGDITFTIDAPVADASWHGSATRPQSNMLVVLNGITYPILSSTANGAGWDVTISRPNPANKSENLGLNGAVTTPNLASFYLRSMIASSGHTMEYVGSGTNYTALPENGGVPDDTAQVIELNDGKVWTAITDHNGKFTVGPLEVDQRTGAITIAAGASVTNVVDDPSPQLGGDLDANNHNIILDTGTAAAPSLRFTADADTGMYSPGANELGLVTNGSVHLTIDGAGVVSIPKIYLTNLELPSGTGTNGQALTTDGSGVLSWQDLVGLLVTDGGNFDNGSSTVTSTQTIDGGSF